MLYEPNYYLPEEEVTVLDAEVEDEENTYSFLGSTDLYQQPTKISAIDGHVPKVGDQIFIGKLHMKVHEDEDDLPYFVRGVIANKSKKEYFDSKEGKICVKLDKDKIKEFFEMDVIYVANRIGNSCLFICY